MLDIQTKFDYLLAMLLNNNVICIDPNGNVIMAAGGTGSTSINADENTLSEREKVEAYLTYAKKTMEKGTDRAKMRQNQKKDPIPVRVAKQRKIENRK